MQNIDIFIAYSQADIAQVEALKKHLTAFERSYPVKIWYDGMIEAGKDWEVEVQAAMNRAEIILLMISADFIASDFWYEKAIPHILELGKKNQIDCLPVLVRKCMWQDTPIAQMKLLPTAEKAIVHENWQTEEEPYMEIVSHVKSIIQRRLDIKKEAEMLENKPVSKNRFLYLGLVAVLAVVGVFFFWQKNNLNKAEQANIAQAQQLYQQYVALGNIELQGKATLLDYVWAREQYVLALKRIKGLAIDSIQAHTRKEKCNVEIESLKKAIIIDSNYIKTAIAYQTALDTAHTIFLEAVALHKKGELVNAKNRYRAARFAYQEANKVVSNYSIELSAGHRGRHAAEEEIAHIDAAKTALSSPIFSEKINIMQADLDPFLRNIGLFLQRKSI